MPIYGPTKKEKAMPDPQNSEKAVKPTSKKIARLPVIERGSEIHLTVL